jgi:hypothetical protein
MQPADLRPLSLGELLDRCFTLYRRHFLLFLGISGVPYVAVLLLNLARIFFLPGLSMPRLPGHAAPAPPDLTSISIYSSLSLLILVTTWVVAVISQGATVVAVSEIYLGRTITIADSFRRGLSSFFRLVGVGIITGIVVVIGCIFLIVPGIYLFCRLLVGVPVTVMEGYMPRQSLERSYSLTQDNAGRAFLILLLYFFLVYVGLIFFSVPFYILIATSQHNPEIAVVWLALATVGQIISTVLVSPILHISSSLFYFDLRIRKEALDLQLMMRDGTSTEILMAPPVVQQPNLFT